MENQTEDKVEKTHSKVNETLVQLQNDVEAFVKDTTEVCKTVSGNAYYEINLNLARIAQSVLVVSQEFKAASDNLTKVFDALTAQSLADQEKVKQVTAAIQKAVDESEFAQAALKSEQLELPLGTNSDEGVKE